jgi:hypothetical protein
MLSSCYQLHALLAGEKKLETKNNTLGRKNSRLSTFSYKVTFMAKTNTTELLEALAAEIGENVYIDIAKWHLYLSDAKLHTAVAEQLYPLITTNSVTEDQVIKVLESIHVKIGGGKKELSLIDLLPLQCQVNLVDILEKYQREI